MSAGGTGGPGCPLRIRLFGPFQVWRDGAPLPPLRTRKGCWLLALLTLHHSRPLDREWLAGTLWPESPESQGLYNLRRTLSDLRRALGSQAERLQVTAHHSLFLDLAGAEADVVAFDEAVAAGDEAALERAVQLHQAPLLLGCTEEWALQERSRREQSYLAALELLASRASEWSDYERAAVLLRQAVAVDPYRETAQRALMEALAAGGDTAAAILVYRQCRSNLHRELNAEPSPETQALFDRLRAEVRRQAGRAGSRAGENAPPAAGGPQQPAPGRPNNLPQPLSAFIGRERELREIGGCLAEARLVTLTGPGGIGKTRLTIRAAEQRVAEHGDDACWVDLAGLADPALVPQAVAHALGVQETGGSGLMEALQEAIGSRPALLVLDNCEHLIDAAASLAEALLSCCSHLCLLATSRQPLGLPGERVWAVPPLSLPGKHSPHESEAVRLFVGRAASHGCILGEDDAPAAAEVCRRLDGIPLAIELAAARLRALSVHQVAARLDDRFRLLTGGSRTALPRQQTLRAALDWSWDLLSEPERVLLRRLSVFAGGWTLEAAEAIADHSDCGLRIADCRLGETRSFNPQSAIRIPQSGNPQSAIRIPQWEVLDLLASLVDKSLVLYEPSGERYRLLETTREYARERLEEAGEGEEWRARHAQYFLALAERAEPELRGPNQAGWLRRLEEEQDNFRTALDWGLSRKDEGGRMKAEGGPRDDLHPSSFILLPLRLAGALGWFWWMRGYLSEGRERLEALLAQRPPAGGSFEPDPVLRARVKALNLAGMIADDQSDYDAAGALFRESLAIARQVGDQPGVGMALNCLGALARHAGDAAAARSFYEESLAIWREVGDRWWIASLLTNLGRVATLAGEDAAARRHLEAALEIQRELGDRRAVARTLAFLGTALTDLGDHAAGRAAQEESLTLVRQLGARVPLLETLTALGSDARTRGDEDAALRSNEERLAIATETGSVWDVAESLYQLGLLARDRGDPDRAAALWEESLPIWQRLGDPQRVADCLEGLAGLAAGRAQIEAGPLDPEGGAGETGEARPGLEWAARLYGAAAALREVPGAPGDPEERAEHERQKAAAHALCRAAPCAAAWAAGRAMTLDQAIACALEEGRGRALC